MKDLYVVNCCRTAIGSFGGSLKNTPAAEMGAVVVKEALKLSLIHISRWALACPSIPTTR